MKDFLRRLLLAYDAVMKIYIIAVFPVLLGSVILGNYIPKPYDQAATLGGLPFAVMFFVLCPGTIVWMIHNSKKNICQVGFPYQTKNLFLKIQLVLFAFASMQLIFVSVLFAFYFPEYPTRDVVFANIGIVALTVSMFVNMTVMVVYLVLLPAVRLLAKGIRFVLYKNLRAKLVKTPA